MALRLFSLFVIVLLTAVSAPAAKIGIVTDQPGAHIANDLKKVIESANCFKDMTSLQIEIKEVTKPFRTKCFVDPNIDRIVNCSAIYAKYASQMKADKLVVVVDSSLSGGTANVNGIGATMTTSLPDYLGLHELLHAFGFDDEYTYISQKEADLYCTAGIKAPNITYFRDRPPYASDSAARKRHAKSIPWYGRMTAALITTLPNLGTPTPNEIGLYPSGNCIKASSKVKAWRPEDKENIMGDRSDVVPDSFCPRIRKILREPEPPPKTDTPLPDTSVDS